MKRFIGLATLLLISLSVPAREEPFDARDPQFLIESCREVVEIFRLRNEKNLLAAIGTSMSEAMRAGYCIGVVQQYRESEPGCRYSSGKRDWFDVAQAIAEQPLHAERSERTAVRLLLMEAYCDG